MKPRARHSSHSPGLGVGSRGGPQFSSGQPFLMKSRRKAEGAVIKMPPNQSPRPQTALGEGKSLWIPRQCRRPARMYSTAQPCEQVDRSQERGLKKTPQASEAWSVSPPNTHSRKAPLKTQPQAQRSPSPATPRPGLTPGPTRQGFWRRSPALPSWSGTSTSLAVFSAVDKALPSLVGYFLLFSVGFAQELK